jgi:hypothetical protein
MIFSSIANLRRREARFGELEPDFECSTSRRFLAGQFDDGNINVQ